MAEVRNVNHLFVTREYPGNDQVVGASDQGEKAHPRSARFRALEAGKKRGIGPQFATDARIEPIGIVGAVVRCTKRDTPINATRAAEFLKVDPGNEAPKTVADKVDTAAADVPPEVLTQSKRGLFDAFAGTVVERENLLDATKAKIRSYREQRRPIREVAMYENDGPLIGKAGRSATRASDPERKERGRCCNA